MASDLQAERLETVRRFFRHSKPQEWAATLPEAPGDVASAYAAELGRMQQEAALLAGELATAGHTDQLQRLIQDARRELLVPVCGALAAEAFAPAVPALLREFRGGSPEAQQAILAVVQATGAAAGYEAARSARKATVPGLREQAERTIAAILAADLGLHHVLRWAGEGTLPAVALPPVLPEAASVAATLVQVVDLPTALVALAALVQSRPELGERTRDELLRYLRRLPATAAETEENTAQRALLLLGSQEWALPPDALRQCRHAFGRAGREDRVSVLKVAPRPVSRAFIRAGLDPRGQKLLEQSLAHLEADIPELIGDVADLLLAVAEAAPPEPGTQALLLLARGLPGERQVELGLPARLLRRLGDGGQRLRPVLAALIATDAGRHLLARESVPGAAWEQINAITDGASAQALLDPLYAALAAGADARMLLDPQRLSWLVARSGKVRSETLAAAAAGLARSIAAQLVYGSDVVADSLAATMAGHLPLWQQVAGMVLPALAGGAPERVQRLLERLPAAGGAPVTEALERLQVILRELLRLLSLGDEVEPGLAEVWLSGHPEIAALLSAEAERLGQAGEAAVASFLAADQADRARLEAEAATMLEALGRCLGEQVAGRPDLIDALTSYAQELSDAVFAVIDAEPEPLPAALQPTGVALYDYRQAVPICREAERREESRGEDLRIQLARNASLPMDKLCLALRDEAGCTAMAEILAGWVDGLGLSRIEQRLGAVVPFRPRMHALVQGEPSPTCTVVSFGLQAGDGSVIAPALVEPTSEREEP